MIYDRPITIYDLPDGTPLQRKLVKVSDHWYAPGEVYHSRFWESVQAGSRVDLMAMLPDGEQIRADQYAIPADGHVYRIVQAQHGLDRDGLPMTTLSLRREESNYDIAGA